MTMLSSNRSHKTGKLDPAAIRARARKIPGCQFIPSDCPTVCSFIVGCLNDEYQDKAGHNIETIARINIFVDTGTIATCRVLQGAVRQTFRQDVSSLDVVERLLRHPQNLTIIDDSLVHMSVAEASGSPSIGKNSSSTSTTKYATFNSQGSQSPSLRLVSQQAKIELADVGASILQNEKEKLQTHLKGLTERPPNAPNSPSERSEATAETTHQTMTAGMEFQFSLPASSMKHVDQCLSDINNMENTSEASPQTAEVLSFSTATVALLTHHTFPDHYTTNSRKCGPVRQRYDLAMWLWEPAIATLSLFTTGHTPLKDQKDLNGN
jgi:hypothetical protein